jgi:hypothetical protein
MVELGTRESNCDTPKSKCIMHNYLIAIDLEATTWPYQLTGGILEGTYVTALPL